MENNLKIKRNLTNYDRYGLRIAEKMIESLNKITTQQTTINLTVFNSIFRPCIAPYHSTDFGASSFKVEVATIIMLQ